MNAAPQRPISIRLTAAGLRLAHRLTGGRLGSLEPAMAAPRGRALELITKAHIRLYRWTGGVLGHDLDGMDILLLTTKGRKTGLPRIAPLPYFPVPGGGYAIVASWAGNAKNPAWYDNLVADPTVEVQIRRRRFQARATPAGPDERPALWASITAAAGNYADYQRITPREIPVVVLRPV